VGVIFCPEWCFHPGLKEDPFVRAERLPKTYTKGPRQSMLLKFPLHARSFVTVGITNLD
jgi:hypothetical protein